MPENQHFFYLKRRNRASLLLLATFASWIISYKSYTSHHPGVMLGIGSSNVLPTFWQSAAHEPVTYAFAFIGALFALGAGFVLFRNALRNF